MWSEQAVVSHPAHRPRASPLTPPRPGHGWTPRRGTQRNTPLPTDGAPGWRAGPSRGGSRWPDGTLPPEPLWKPPLEDLQEFLQDTLSPGRALQAS